MVGNVIKKSLGAVLIVTTHIIFFECNAKQFPAGTNITLKFSFNISITNKSHFAVYRVKGPEERKKIAEYINGPHPASDYGTYPKNGSVFCNFTNLTLNHSGNYLASLFLGPGRVSESQVVQLIVHKENISTVTPEVDLPTAQDSGSSSFSHIIAAVFVVLSVSLLAAALIWLIWSMVKTKDKQEPSPHQNSTPTIQETAEAPSQAPVPSLIYSVLDFPKRASAVQEVNLRDTEYAAISYLTEKRGM